MNKNPDRDSLQDYLAAWRSHLERQISEARVMPDLIDVYERARSGNLEDIANQDSEEVDILGEVLVEMDDGSLQCSDSGDAKTKLESFYQDWKARIDSRCDQILRDRQFDFERSRQSHKKNWKPRIALSLSMAAAVAGLWFLPQFQRFGPMLRSQTMEAQHSVNLVDRSTHHQYTQARHFTAAEPSIFEEVMPEKSSSNELQFLDHIEISLDHASAKHEYEFEQAKEDAKEELSPIRGRESKQSRESRLQVLDRKAREYWRQGNIEQAQKHFIRLTKIGGRSELAELAFGDLFALAREYEDSKRMRTLWTQYLRRFPNGVFAQDARAGLCRHQRPGKQMQACWNEYLQMHPSGAHHQEAALRSRGVATERK